MQAQIWVDFNDIQQDFRTFTLLKYATNEAAVVPSASLRAGDDEGNQCVATVVAITDGVVELMLDMGTFQAGR